MHTDVNHPSPLTDRLRQLPAELAPPYSWQEFKRRARPAASPARAAMSWRHAAVAAVTVVGIVAVALWSRLNEPAPRTASTPVSIGDPHALGRAVGGDSLDRASRPGVSAPDGSAGEDSPSSGQRRAGGVRPEALERWLAALPQEPAVVRVGTRAAVVGLEDQLAQVDDLLNGERLDGGGQQRLAALQEQRTRLMGSLAQVRYAEALDAQASP